ncbi:MAG: PQQ-dependent sugar dehydrogenase, partial [Pseudomonadota bacterium]
MRLALVLALAALPASAQTFDSSAGPLTVTQVAGDLEHPWGVDFLPSGDMLVTEREGNLWIVTPDGLKTRVRGVPRVRDAGQGGLLDVAVSPQ